MIDVDFVYSSKVCIFVLRTDNKALLCCVIFVAHVCHVFLHNKEPLWLAIHCHCLIAIFSFKFHTSCRQNMSFLFATRLMNITLKTSRTAFTCDCMECTGTHYVDGWLTHRSNWKKILVLSNCAGRKMESSSNITIFTHHWNLRWNLWWKTVVVLPQTVNRAQPHLACASVLSTNVS